MARYFENPVRPKWTLIFIATAIFVFILEILFSEFDPSTGVFSFVPSLLFERPWTLITSIFIHGSFSHLFYNMFGLFIFGLYLESRIGERNFFLIFFLSGILGNIGYMLTALNPNTPGVGASGAVYGIMGALAMIAPFAIVYTFPGFPMPMIVAVFFWGFLEFTGLIYEFAGVSSGIARGAHLAGLFGGILFGLYIRQFKKKRKITYEIRW